MMFQLINDFYDNPKLWNQTGIIFTRCYQGYFDRENAETRYRPKIINFIKKLPGCQNIEPELPCFFVDSPNWEHDESTRREYDRVLEYSLKFQPFLSNQFKYAMAEYKQKEEELLENVLVILHSTQSSIHISVNYHYLKLDIEFVQNVLIDQQIMSSSTIFSVLFSVLITKLYQFFKQESIQVNIITKRIMMMIFTIAMMTYLYMLRILIYLIQLFFYYSNYLQKKIHSTIIKDLLNRSLIPNYLMKK